MVWVLRLLKNSALRQSRRNPPTAKISNQPTTQPSHTHPSFKPDTLLVTNFQNYPSLWPAQEIFHKSAHFNCLSVDHFWMLSNANNTCSQTSAYHSAVHQSFCHELAEKAELGLDLVDVRHLSIASKRRRKESGRAEHIHTSIVVQLGAFHRITAPQL